MLPEILEDIELTKILFDFNDFSRGVKYKSRRRC